jgi:N4-gp56 family major capsid protein
MAETTVLSGLELIKWQRQFIYEFVRESGFEPYMGAGRSIIHTKNDLQGDGYTIRIPLLLQLTGDGVSGNSRLAGNEEELDQYYQDVSWDFYRHAVTMSKKDRSKSAVDLLSAARETLKTWATEKMKYQLIDQFHGINGALYTAASEAAKDAWVAANTDRVRFGAALSNHSGGDHSAALANVDSTNDKLTATMLTALKRQAMQAYPKIRPHKVSGYDQEYYVMFAHPRCFRDLKTDSTITQANREARPREVGSNPLFQDGDLLWDGVIIRQIAEFETNRDGTVNSATTLDDVGNGSIDVGVNFFCGAQALCVANKQAPIPTMLKEDDYGFFKGVGIEMAHGIEKLTWNNGSGTRKDVGMITCYASATPDA